jgi:hypothetical protein
LLEQGKAARDVVSAITDADMGRDQRQVHVMDAQGCIAAHTGNVCMDWCGNLTGDDISVAGNMLLNPGVIEDTARAYERNNALSFPRRLIAALRAGEAAGGDKRGKQSAALLICGEEEWPDLNLRVDDHTDPLGELERLEGVSRERFVHLRRFLPNRRDRVGVTDRALIEGKSPKPLPRKTRHEGRGRSEPMVGLRHLRGISLSPWASSNASRRLRMRTRPIRGHVHFDLAIYVDDGIWVGGF